MGSDFDKVGTALGMVLCNVNARGFLKVGKLFGFNSDAAYAMRATVVILFFSLKCIHSSGQLNTVWLASKKISWNNYGYCVSTGPEGNVYVSGAFTGPYRNPGPKDMGCFFTCYDSTGKEQWHKEFYNPYQAIAAFNAVDSKGNIIFAGPGLFRFNNKGEQLDSFPSIGLNRAEGLCIDSEDNIILAGLCYGDSIIGNIKIEGGSFVAKYSPNGSQLWAKPCYISSYVTRDFDVAVDKVGNILVGGGFRSTLSFSPLHQLLSNGQQDAYVAKYDPEFNLLWTKSFGGIYADYVLGISTDCNGNVIVSGSYGSPFTIESQTVPSPLGGGNVFVVQLNREGEFQWLRSVNGDQHLLPREITVDEADNILVAGDFPGAQTIRSGSLQHTTKAHLLARNIFLARWDKVGNAISLTCSQDGGGGQGRDVTCDNSGHIYLTGGFGGLLDFNAGQTMDGGEEGGMFLAKFIYDKNDQVGIKEPDTRNELFQIFPNPGKGVFNVSLSDDLCVDACIQVYETSGRSILSKRSIGCDERSFQCSVPPGVYLVELRSGQKRQTRKVIVQ